MVPVTRYSERTDSANNLEDEVQIRELALEYAETIRRSGVAWEYVHHPRDGSLQFETFQYLPEYHFRTGYDRLRKRSDLESDGGYDTLHTGKRPVTVYYWVNPETGGALYHTGVNDEETVPFFSDEASAKDFLAERAATGESEQYAGLSLYQARSRKVSDAVDVLTDQAGFEEFLSDH